MWQWVRFIHFLIHPQYNHNIKRFSIQKKILQMNKYSRDYPLICSIHYWRSILLILFLIYVTILQQNTLLLHLFVIMIVVMIQWYKFHHMINISESFIVMICVVVINKMQLFMFSSFDSFIHRVWRNPSLPFTTGPPLTCLSTSLIILSLYQYPLLQNELNDDSFIMYPAGWIDAGHRNGVPVLGTIIIEGQNQSLLEQLLTGPDHSLRSPTWVFIEFWSAVDLIPFLLTVLHPCVKSVTLMVSW